MIPSRSRSDLAAAKDKREPLAVTSLVKNYEGEDDLLGEGYLTKIGQRWKSHKRRWFVITFTDIRYYESRDKYESNAKPLGTIFVNQVESIGSSNALGFGENTSLVIKAGSRSLVVGDQKEGVAESLLFPLKKWLSLRDEKKDPLLPAALSIPVSDMPQLLQRDVFRYFEELQLEHYVDVLQDPPGMFSWQESAKEAIIGEYRSLFEKIFNSPASLAKESLQKYIMLNNTWTSEIVIYPTALKGSFYRICLDPEPLLHFLADHFATIKKIDLSCFDYVLKPVDLADKLALLRTSYKWLLPELYLPTNINNAEEITFLVDKFAEVMPGIHFDASLAHASTKAAKQNGKYFLHLLTPNTRESLPSTTAPINTEAPADEDAAPMPTQIATMATGIMRMQLT